MIMLTGSKLPLLSLIRRVSLEECVRVTSIGRIVLFDQNEYRGKYHTVPFISISGYAEIVFGEAGYVTHTVRCEEIQIIVRAWALNDRELLGATLP